MLAGRVNCQSLPSQRGPCSGSIRSGPPMPTSQLTPVRRSKPPTLVESVMSVPKRQFSENRTNLSRNWSSRGSAVSGRKIRFSVPAKARWETPSNITSATKLATGVLRFEVGRPSDKGSKLAPAIHPVDHYEESSAERPILLAPDAQPESAGWDPGPALREPP